jgi:PTS system IIBC component
MFKQLQQVGKSFILPSAILPAVGLLLGIGGTLSNKATVQAYPILDNSLLQGILQIMFSLIAMHWFGNRLSQT